MVAQYTKLPRNTSNGDINIPTSSSARPSKIFPNWDFWFENMPSGNPDFSTQEEVLVMILVLTLGDERTELLPLVRLG
jgi:hypothetical protein